MYREDRRWFEVRRLVSAFAMAIVLLLFALPAAAQDDGLQVCDWYWDYKFNSSGGWEYWCWHPQLGWWYSESEDGKRKSVSR